MINILLLLLRRSIINRMRHAHFGSQLINDVLRALKLPETGFPEYSNPPRPPKNGRDPRKDIGKRAINWLQDCAGIITDAWPDEESRLEAHDVLVLDDRKVWGHRQYFYVEGDQNTGELFNLNKNKYFK